MEPCHGSRVRVELTYADLTALVQAWVDGVHPNHGFLLEEDPTALTAYRSSEHANTGDRPWLEVCFY